MPNLVCACKRSHFLQRLFIPVAAFRILYSLPVTDEMLSLPVASLFLYLPPFLHRVLPLRLMLCQHCRSPGLLWTSSVCKRSPQDFPLLRLDDIVDEQSNIVGFSMFNTTHPFYLEFIRSLNLSWREGCDLTYPGPAVSLCFGHVTRIHGAEENYLVLCI